MSVKTLVVGMAALFGKKGSSGKQWGHFGAEEREGRFPESFDEFVADTTSAPNFLNMSHVALDELVAQAAVEPWATGGHLLCALYEFTAEDDAGHAVDIDRARQEEDNEGDESDEHLWEGPHGEVFCLVAMVKQRDGLSLDDNLVPKGNKSVDLSKIHQAALIQLNKYLEAKALQPRNDDAGDAAAKAVHANIYLSFIGQKAKGSSAYFIDALGCKVGIGSSQATKLFFDAVAEYFDTHELLRPYHRAARDRLVEHLERAIENNESVGVAGIRDIVLRDVPQPLTHELDDLETFMNDAHRQVPATFVANKAMVTRVKRVMLKGDRFDLKFDRGLLGSDANSDFHYSRQERTLTIRNLDKSQMVKLDKALAER